MLYKKPELNVISFDVQENMMNDGYSDGDTDANPWEDVLKDPSSDGEQAT